MKPRFLTALLLAGTLALGTAPAQAADPGLHEVYAAAQSGRMDQALSMMDQVLTNHPNSGKAHYVEAELLAKAGRMSQARSELETAERLAPGLPFAQTASLNELRARLADGAPHDAEPLARSARPGGLSGTSWLLVGLVVLGVILAARALVRRANPTAGRFGGGANMGMNPGYGSDPHGPQGGPMAGPLGSAMGGSMGSSMGGGMGSRMMGGLATGAALGAGMVAGEALADRLMGGSHPATAPTVMDPTPDPGWDNAGNYDMGGNDFGVADGGSWDDGSGGGGSWDVGGDDWN